MSESTAHHDTFARDHLPPRTLWPEMDYTALPELTAYPARLNAATELLERRVAEGGGERTALLWRDTRWSYAALDRRASQIASLLTAQLGHEPGTRVLLRSGNHPWLAAAWFGVLKAGGIPIVSMPVLRERELEHILIKARVQLAIAERRLAADLEGAARRAPCLRETLYFGDGGDLEARAERLPPTFPTVQTSAEDVAIIGFTSGSTGAPKATVHFHRDLLAAADCFIGHVVGIRADDIVCGSPQIAFLYGLCAFLVDTPRFGAAAVLLERPTPAAVLQAIEHHRATVCFSTPSGYQQMLARADGHDLSSLRVCVAGGEPLAPAVHDAWRALTGVTIINGLGISELLHIFISTAGRHGKPGSIGTAVPGFRVRVVDAAMQDVPAGEVGQMIVKGPNGCRYLDDPERQRAYVRDGWNLSGDLCRVDRDGDLFYVSRSDDMIVTGGYNVAAPEVEAVLLEHPAVRECAVVGAPDAERGEIVKAFVVLGELATAGPELAAELQAFVKARIAPFKQPRAFDFVDALPQTPSGKIRRSALRAPPGEGA